MTTEAEVHEGEVVEDEQPSVAALALREPTDALVRPAASLGDIEDAFHDYQQLARSLLDDSDYQEIAGKRFRKRSAWRKLAVAFGVTFEIRVDGRRIDRDDAGDVIRAEFVVRAIAPNGRYADGWGACDRYERCCQRGCRKGGRHSHCPRAKGEACPGITHFSHAEHDIPATSETRAKNRAAADLFGMGEVSAEEVVGDPGTSDSSASSEATKPEPLATEKQLKLLNVLAQKMGAEDDEARYRLASQALGRQIRSYKQITKAEAHQLIDRWQADAEESGAGQAASSVGPEDGEGPAPDAPATEKTRDKAVLHFGSPAKVQLAWKKATGEQRNFADLSEAELEDLLKDAGT